MEEDILRLHKAGLSNRQIAVSLGLKSHHGISPILKKFNLTHNGSVRKERLEIQGGRGKCTKCKEWKDLGQFRVNRRGEKYEYRLTFCNHCGWNQRNKYLNSNTDAYIKDCLSCIRQHSKNRKVKKEFNLTLEYILKILNLQKGRCAYTGERFTMQKGRGLVDETMSFDRWDSKKGYIEGNVLLCTKQANMVKSNLSVSKFSKWMPALHQRGLKILMKIRKF